MNLVFVAVITALFGVAWWAVETFGLRGAIGFALAVLAGHLWWRWKFGYWAGDGDDTIDLD